MAKIKVSDLNNHKMKVTLAIGGEKVKCIGVFSSEHVKKKGEDQEAKFSIDKQLVGVEGLEIEGDDGTLLTAEQTLEYVKSNDYLSLAFIKGYWKGLADLT